MLCENTSKLNGYLLCPDEVVLYRVAQSLLFIEDMLSLSTNARRSQNVVTVDSGVRYDEAANQLNSPHRFDINDDNQSIVIDDYENHRIVDGRWEKRMAK